MRERQIVEDSASSSASDTEHTLLIEQSEPVAAAPLPAAPVPQISIEQAVAVLETPVVVGRVQRSFGDGLIVQPRGALLRLGESVFAAVEGRAVRVGSLGDVFGSIDRYFYFVALNPALQAYFDSFRGVAEVVVDACTAQFLSPAEFEEMKRQKGSDAVFDADQGLPVQGSDSEEEGRGRARAAPEPGESKRFKPVTESA